MTVLATGLESSIRLMFVDEFYTARRICSVVMCLSVCGDVSHSPAAGLRIRETLSA